MLKTLRIKNFKSWEDTKEIQLAPLTVICGTNSSGKSSLAQLLLMLKQTVESSDRTRVLHTGDANSSIDLGLFQDIICKHEINRNLEFEIGLTLPEPLKFNDPVNKRDYISNDLSFSSEISYQKEGRLQVNQLNYRLFADLQFGLLAKEKGYDLNSALYPLKRQQGRPWHLPSPSRFYGFPSEATIYYQNTSFLADFELSLETFFKKMTYLGPLREHPKRLYTYADGAPISVGQKGEKAIEALLASKNKKISSGYKKKGESFEGIIARWLKEMQLIDYFRVERIEGRKDYEVKVKIHETSSEVLITDVGFGVSQILPVIIQAFYAPAHSTVIFEQPEIHLHPSVQSKLADLFIEAIKSRENGEDRKMQFIIETHSEHFLRRLQRRIAEESLKKEDLAAYFVHLNKDGLSEINQLEIDDFGNINNWPEHFFGDDFEDVAEMTKASLKRKMTASHG